MPTILSFHRVPAEHLKEPMGCFWGEKTPKKRRESSAEAERTCLGGGVEKRGAPGAPGAVGRAEPAPDLKHVLGVTLQVVPRAGPVRRRAVPRLHLQGKRGARWGAGLAPHRCRRPQNVKREPVAVAAFLFCMDGDGAPRGHGAG